MRNFPENSRSFWLTVLAFTLAVNIAMMRLTYLRLVELKADLLRSTWSGMLVLCFVIAIVCAWSMFRIARDEELINKFSTNNHWFQSNGLVWRLLGGVIFLAILFLIPYVKFTYQIGQDVKLPVYDPVLLLLIYYWLCWWMLLLAMTALKISFSTSWEGGFVSAVILLGVAYEILLRFNVVTTYPLSMGWSEGSRYYYASLFFSKSLYGQAVPLSTLHPTRYLLQSIPFLFPSLGLFAHRFWQFLLWISLTAGAAIALSQRVFQSFGRSVRWLFAGWFFLYLLRIGVYYHLEVMVVGCLLFISRKHPWRSLITVILTSLWAGISRVNWFPVPAMIAIAIYLLETPVQSDRTSSTLSSKSILQYLSQPALWAVVGLVSALIAQAAYIPLSGNANNVQAFESSFTSDLLWYRLWPNDSFPMGIVPALLIVSGPLILTFIIALKHWKALHPIRWAGLISMLLVLLAGSLVVSVKIGGGGDLHNTDAFAVLIGIVAAYFIGGQVRAEAESKSLDVVNWSVITVAVLIPILFLIPSLSPYPKFNEAENQLAYEQLIQTVNDASKNGLVLMISERQLITYGDLKIPLVPDYEVVTLMEMAMSHNQAYLNRFYSDLQQHRFAAIVASKQNLGIKLSGPFFEENNVWNTLVSPYILCYYEPTTAIDGDLSNIQVLTPRSEPGDCQ